MFIAIMAGIALAIGAYAAYEELQPTAKPAAQSGTQGGAANEPQSTPQPGTSGGASNLRRLPQGTDSASVM